MLTVILIIAALIAVDSSPREDRNRDSIGALIACIIAYNLGTVAMGIVIVIFLLHIAEEKE